MVQTEYTVRVEDFEGPLDLLLFLVRRAEVDIEHISIADITDQYVRHMERVDRIDVDSAGEFLVVAATLLELKSRLVGHNGDEDKTRASLGAVAGDDEDPASDLIRQLLRYKAFRDAADALESRREDWLRRYPAGKASVDFSKLKEEQADESAFVEDLDVVDLVRAFRKIAETVVFDRLGEHEVAYDDTPIELHAEDIVDQLTRAGAERETMPLRRVFEGRNRSEMIGLFLALLELVRQRRVRVTQPAREEEIVMRLTSERERAESLERDAQHDRAEANVEAKPEPDADWDDDHILDDEDIDDDEDDEF